MYRLELEGPTGTKPPTTKDRAELRAIIGVFQIKYRKADCWAKTHRWDRLVITTSSDYVFMSATEKLRRWERDGWRYHNGGEQVENSDLWEVLLMIIRDLAREDRVPATNVGVVEIPEEENGRLS